MVTLKSEERFFFLSFFLHEEIYGNVYVSFFSFFLKEIAIRMIR
jgi:hypothetical protein